MHRPLRNIASHRRTFTIVQSGLHRLYHHDGIIHHRTDDQYEGEERQHIQREADGIDHCQRSYERHDDGNGRNNRGPPALQEDEHHENNQHQCLKQRFHHIDNGGVEEVFLRLDILDGDARRQRLTDLLHLTVYLLDDLVGVRPSHLIDADVHTWTAIRFTYYIIVLRTEFHPGNVADAQHVTVGQRAHHHLLITLFVLITATIFQHILERVLALGTQRTRRHFHVLFTQHLIDVGRCQSVAGHLLRVEPDAHRVVSTHHVHLSHSGNTAQARLDVDLRIVGQERAVEGAVRTIDRQLLDVRRLSLTHSDTTLHHIARQSSLHGGGTVLHVHHRHIGVCALTEEDANGGSAVVRGRRGHIHHTLHTVDGLLERHDDTLLHRLGVGTGIAGHHAHRRRGNLRELLQCQTAQSDDAHQHHQHRNDSRQYRTVYKSSYIHFFSFKPRISRISLIFFGRAAIIRVISVISGL